MGKRNSPILLIGLQSYAIRTDVRLGAELPFDTDRNKVCIVPWFQRQLCRFPKSGH